jgi:hypothetical protein
MLCQKLELPGYLVKLQVLVQQVWGTPELQDSYKFLDYTAICE